METAQSAHAEQNHLCPHHTASRISFWGTFQVVQWLRLHAARAGGTGSIPGWEQRSYMPLRMAKKKKKTHFKVEQSKKLE